MIKLFTTLLLLNVLLYSEPLPISTEFTDWDKVNKDITKKKCISIRKLIFKGFEKGISFKPSQILLWNNHCQALTNFYIYTPQKCESMYKNLVSVDFSKVNRESWNSAATSWNKVCGPIKHLKLNFI